MRAVEPVQVVVDPPVLEEDPCFEHGFELLAIQEIVAKPIVE